MNSQDYINLDTTYSAPNYHPIPVVVERAEDVWVWDVEGKRYLDCLGGYSAVSQGHSHPRLIQAMTEQMQKVTLTARAFHNDQMGLFLKKLCELTGYEQALPMNTGAEAVETAIKAARKWGYQVKGIPAYQAEIITCANNFHGRTTTIISFSTEAQYQENFGPFTPGFKTIPYGDADALEAAITPNTAAFLVEPVQGEAGIIVPPDGYLRAVRDICTRHNVLLIADEIQSGLGRTGKFLATQHEDVRADMVILGKALGGGFYPVSAVVADRNIMGLFRPGDHGSTFGGNPLGAAVGRAALQVLVDEGMVENSAVVGDYFRGRLERIEGEKIKEVRGRGLFIGVELHTPARPYVEALMESGVLSKETHENVIRFAPPLTMTRAQVDWAMGRIEPVLSNGVRA